MNFSQVKNNSYCYLEAELDTTSTSFTTTSDFNLPSDTTASGNFYLTLFDSTSNEILLVTNIIDGTSSNKELTVTRAQQNTTAKIWPIDSTGWINVTEANFEEIHSALNTLASDDISDSTSSNKFATAAQLAKVDYLTITQAVDLDTLESDVATNTAKVSNATHTGEVTGSGALTIDPTAISGKTGVTPTSGDYLLLWDATDSTLKKADASNFLAGSGDVVGPASSTDTAIAVWDGTSGDTLKDSSILIDVSNNVSGINQLVVDEQARHSTNSALATSGSISWNIQTTPKANITAPTGNISLSLTNVEVNSEAVLYFIQDTTSAITITWDTDITWIGGYEPDLSTLGSTWLFSFYSPDGTGLIGIHSNTENAITGLFNVLDTTSDQYYIGSNAVANPIAFGTYALIQFKNNFSIYGTNSSNTSTTISHNLYQDVSGLSTYVNDSDGQKIVFNAGDTEFYYSDLTSHLADDLADVYKRFTIGYSGISLRNNAGTLVFNVDVTGNITTSGLVDGVDVASIGTKVGYLTVTGSTNLDTINTKVGYLTITQAVDLDTLESNVATNNAKVSNATHTGEVTGSTSLVIDPTAISGKTAVTPVATDYLLLWDATDSTLKKVDASNFLTVYGDVTGPASATDTAITLFSGTTGKLLKNSVVTIDTDGDIAGVKSISFNGATSGTSVISAPAIAGSGVYSLPSDSTDTLVATAAVQILSNKTIIPRIEAVSDGATVTFNCDDYDMGEVTLTASRILGAPTGTPHNGQKYLLKCIQGTGGSHTFSSYNSVFSFGDAGEPTLSTTEGKYDYLFFMYASNNSKWNFLTIASNF